MTFFGPCIKIPTQAVLSGFTRPLTVHQPQFLKSIFFRYGRNKLSILTINNCLDPLLRKKCALIENIGDSLVALSRDMIETIFDVPGAGLAANQVGVASRLIVVDLGIKEEKQNPVVIVNPEITAMEDEIIGEEGCLSIPDLFAEVKRAKRVELKGVDLNGKDIRLEGEGFYARVFQHELDHLNGILFWDKLGKVKRDILKRKFKKMLKETVNK